MGQCFKQLVNVTLNLFGRSKEFRNAAGILKLNWFFCTHKLFFHAMQLTYNSEFFEVSYLYQFKHF